MAFVGSFLASSMATTATLAATPAEDVRDEAKRLFLQGSAAFSSHRYAEALEMLQASFKLVRSPNSGLLIARCLRELNRPVDALEMYDAVAADAYRRVADGDTKYAQTATAAANEGSAVRATLGTIRVRIAGPTKDLRLEIDGLRTPPISPAGEAIILHPPGEVTVRLNSPVGLDQSQVATVVRGGTVRMEFVAPESTRDPSPRETNSKSSADHSHVGPPPSWTFPAALVAGGVAAVGTGVFVGFGLRSQSIYDKLETRCSTAGCGPNDRELADEGASSQTVANVGLAIGIVGAATTIAFLLVRAYAPRPSRDGAQVSRRVQPFDLRVNF